MNVLRTLVTLAAAGGVVAAGQAATRPAGQPAGGDAVTTSVPATEAALVCPGAPLIGVKDVDDVRTSSAVAAQAAPAELLDELVRDPLEEGTLTLAPLDDSGTVSPAEGRRAVRTGTFGSGTEAVATEDRAPGLVATDETVARSARVAGAATAPCVAPSADQWLIGGGPGAGRQERLLLVNLGDNPVSVDLTSLDSSGRQTPPAGQDVSVPARSRVALLLDGITSGSQRQVIRVVSRGGQVGAWLVDHSLDGLTPTGLEVVPATGQPTRSVVLAGAPEGASTVVLAAPGDADAVVTVRSVDGERSRSVGVVTVPAGSSAEVEVPAGTGARSLVVTSDEPVVAAAEGLGQAGTGDRRDLAWSVAAPAANDLLGAAVPDAVAGLTRSLVLTPTEGTPEVEVVTVSGDAASTRTVRLESDRSSAVDLGDAEAVWVRPVQGRGVRAALVTEGDAGGAPALSVEPLLRARVSQRSTEVLPVP